MKYVITDKCIGCHACKLVCPSHAIFKKTDDERFFAIHPNRCSGCVGSFEHPQCTSICPVEEAIVDQVGKVMNPKGSLTGLSV
ncbi:4Fe-4S binding protein [Vibrio hangzhouensis]|uniref:4Fe-4S dicluster domain-containing protein n=1 Tax=Vibrio hangzhouensis TaxID=462991 RepID=A0A1H5TFY1_9VIBR|nr:4Fe-4S binding protein [Vibrio hangzhouensis]SEF61725.1 4Fe-4S dicluster domain-containing protein [Vibrio hangzhouensis]